MSARRKKWGQCKHCGSPAWHKCRRCRAWLCHHGMSPCGQLRRVRNEVGRYDLVCYPKCRKTRSDIGTQKPGGEA